MTKVKICGLSRQHDIEAVNLAEPDYIGFVFAESRRKVNTQTVAMLKKELNSNIKAVGVFVNEQIESIERIYRDGIIDMVQLHGDEDSEYIAQLRNICGCPIIKAVRIGTFLPDLPSEPNYLLFDTLSEQRGGTGKSFNWNLLDSYEGSPYFLAGGLNVSTIGAAIQQLAPYCVDVSGGVETDGVKDLNKIMEFVKTVRSYSK